MVHLDKALIKSKNVQLNYKPKYGNFKVNHGPGQSHMLPMITCTQMALPGYKALQRQEDMTRHR